MKKEYIYAFIAVLIWGTCAPISKLIFDSLSEELLLFMSSLLAFLFLGILNLINRKKIKEKNYKIKDFIAMALLGFLGLSLYTYFYYSGIARLPSGEACTLNYLWPMMIIIFSIPILKEKLTVKKAASVILSFIGVILVATQGNFSNLADIDFIGVFFCIAAAVCYGLYCVLLKKKQYDEMLLLMVAYFVTAVFSGLICIFKNSFTEISPNGWTGIFWEGIAVSALAYLFWSKGLNSGDTAKISNIAYMTPFLSIIFGKIILNEDISFKSFIGLILILSGIIFQIFKIPFKKHENKTEN